MTAVYTFEFLKKMNNSTPHVIAKHDDVVVAYCLAVSVEICAEHDLLSDLVAHINRLSYKGRSLRDCKYIVIGQLCVKKGYRGIGVVPALFNLYRERYSSEYEFPITDVARVNRRSIRVFTKSGYEVIASLEFDGVVFDVVIWDWNKIE